MRRATCLLAIATLTLLGSCGEGNPGYDPPSNALSFPSGLLLDPRVSSEPTGVCTTTADCSGDAVCTSAGECLETARWLFVTNANSDLRFNAGSLMAIDLDGFWRAIQPEDPEDIHPAGTEINPDAAWTSDSPVCGKGSATGNYCRRVAHLPQVVECLEEPFVCSEATVHFGNFPGPAVAWTRDDATKLLIPVRGDPSITFTELSGEPQGQPRFACGQDGDPDGGRYCDDDHRLRFARNDPDGKRLVREPFRILVSPDPELPYAYVSHQGNAELTVLKLTGLHYEGAGGQGIPGLDPEVSEGKLERPAIVHQAALLAAIGFGNTVQGGFGLAQRPCSVDDDNAPTSTLGCTRPLVYASMRWLPQVRTLTAIEYDLPSVCEDSEQLETLDPTLVVGYCEPQGEPLRYLSVGNISTAGVTPSTARPILADVGFSRDGSELYVVQSNPGALLRIDTSIGSNGEAVDVPAGQVEICAQGTSLVLYDAGASQYGLVTCYRSGEVFIVDLASLKVVGVSRAGIGPDSMAVDLAREVVYVANSLDETISVIDMSPARETRFTQIARLGLQEPYVQ